MVCRFKNSSPVKIMQTVWIILNQAVHQPWAHEAATKNTYERCPASLAALLHHAGHRARLSAVEVGKALLGRGGPLAGPFQTLIYSHPRN